MTQPCGATTLELSSGSIDSDGESIYWELVQRPDDDRPVVVLSHGAGGSHAVWYQQIAALGAQFRVLTWDSRGFGNSTNRANSPSAQAAATDLAAVLDDRGIERCHLIGQSLGGWHISGFAQAHPTRVLSMVYADTIGALWTPRLREAFAAFMASGGLTPTGPTLLGNHPALWPGTGERDIAQSFLYRALGSFHSPPMDQLGTTIDWSLPHEEVNALGVPVLFIAGQHDQLFPPELLAESAAQLTNGTFVEIAEAGHSPYFEQPAAWNEAVLAFLTGA